MDSTLRIMAAFAKLFIVNVIVASMIAASVNCEKAYSGRRFLQWRSMTEPPQPEAPLLVPIWPRPGCSLGPVCPPGNTIICENDEVTGETGGCICALVHLCHPGRTNCALYGDRNVSTGTPCGF